MTKSRKSKSSADKPQHVGRFAPSPTGPLHLGSLICAVASYLDARANSGRWLLRMEDLDPPREVAGAAKAILHSLKVHGLLWDGDVLWQSQRHDAYAATVADLLDSGRAFRCDCSRARLAAGGNIYRGHCRQRQLADGADTAVRVLVEGDSRIAVEDALQETLVQDVAAEVGDFIIQRKDALYAYQLAVVVDDAFQGVTRVLRGSDLHDSTPRQVYLQRLLRLPTPEYVHIPVVTDEAGRKLSKQTFAQEVDDRLAVENLRLSLRFLGQRPPDAALRSPAEVLERAVAQWRLEAVPPTAAIAQSSLY